MTHKRTSTAQFINHQISNTNITVCRIAEANRYYCLNACINVLETCPACTCGSGVLNKYFDRQCQQCRISNCYSNTLHYYLNNWTNHHEARCVCMSWYQRNLSDPLDKPIHHQYQHYSLSDCWGKTLMLLERQQQFSLGLQRTLYHMKASQVRRNKYLPLVLPAPQPLKLFT